MSEFTNRDVHRGDGVSGRGLLIGVLVVLVLIIGLAIIGSNSTPGDPAASVDGASSTPAIASDPETPSPAISQ